MSTGFFEMRIGFSTGSVALDDVRRGLTIASHLSAKAVELSALREDELDPLLGLLNSLDSDLKQFDYVSFHAPSKRRRFTEADFVDKLRPVAARGWAIIVHPDVIEDFGLWRSLGAAVCIENMDKRKEIGRTAAQLKTIFDKLPDATFCFDIGHARQVDPTMMEASLFLRMFSNRLKQVHMSFVNSQSRHERLNFESISAFRLVSRWIEDSIPIILETPVTADEVAEEIDNAVQVFNAKPVSEVRSVAAFRSFDGHYGRIKHLISQRTATATECEPLSPEFARYEQGVIELLERSHFVTRRQITEQLQISKKRALEIIRKLAVEGKLRAEGRGKNTHYVPIIG